MSKTAYSNYYSSELDVEQLLRRLDLLQGQTLYEIDLQTKDWIKVDLLCPSCGVAGAQVVIPAKFPQKRQAHFRFINPTGGDSHHRFCDFYSNDKNATTIENLVDFSSSRTTETQVIRRLVCKGIELEIFNQKVIRNMRQWYFDTKVSSRFELNIEEQGLDWIHSLSSSSLNSHSVPFHPSFGELKNFNRRSAATEKFREIYRSDIQEMRNDSIYPSLHIERAKILLRKYKNQIVFNPITLRSQYIAVLNLYKFISANQIWEINVNKWYKNLYAGKISNSILAFISLLLYSSEWNEQTAVQKLIRIVNAGAPNDESLRNVIGLNPFYDFAAWQLLVFAAQKREASPKAYLDEINQIENEMRASYQQWKINSIPR